MIRSVVATLLFALAAGPVTALAASLPVRSAQLGSGPAPTISCDGDGVTATHVVVLGLVTAVVVGGIADGSATAGAGSCDGVQVHVQGVDVAGRPLAGATGSVTVVADEDVLPDQVSVPLAVAPAATELPDVRITMDD